MLHGKIMNGVEKKVTCDCCGEKVFRRSIQIENLHNYDTNSKSTFIGSLMSVESISLEVATSWAEHGLFAQCIEKKRDCPECGKQLKTWMAKLCSKCGGKFEPWRGSEYINIKSISEAD